MLDALVGYGLVAIDFVVPGGVGFRRDGGGGFVGAFSFYFFPELPLDLTGTKQLRFLMYIRSNSTADTSLFGQHVIRLVSPGNNEHRWTFSNHGRVGWQELNCELANPGTVIGAGADLSNVTNVLNSMAWGQTGVFQSEEAVILKRVYYTPRDMGSLADGRNL